MIGANFRDFTLPEMLDDYHRVFTEIYRTGKSGTIVDNQIVRPDGEMVHTEMKVSLMFDETGAPAGFHGISRDVTKRKAAERALLRSEEKYRNILESIEDGYYELDLEGNLTFYNSAMARMLGFDPDHIPAVSYRDFIDVKDVDDVLLAFVQVYETGQPARDIRSDFICNDGVRRTMETSASLRMGENGKPAGFRGISRDITRRRQAELALAEARDRAEAATRAKSDFLANMSHEIRTPMNGIIGMYNLLMDTPLTREQADFVETGKRSADSLMGIINDILDFSKIEAGKLDIEEIDFDVRKAVAELVALPAMQAQQKGLEFAYHIAHDVPSLLRGDPGRLRQILMNLATNAIKFTREGEIVLRVFLESETDDDALLRFTIRDTGIGISEKDQVRLFDAFEQADTSTTRQFGGTGLGLTICKRLVELMGGEIGVKSDLEEGTTFWFTCRFAKQAACERSAFEVPASIQGKRVLIVDDNQTNLDILAGYLDLWGCSSDQATNVQMALSLMHAVAKAGAPYDLVITDMLMRGVDGAELGRRIKADPRLEKTLLVMLTSQGVRGDAAEMKRIGFAAYLTKPVRRSLLFDCLATVFSREAVRDETTAPPPLVTAHSLIETRPRDMRLLLVEDNLVNQKLALALLKRFGMTADMAGNGKIALERLAGKHYDLVLMDVQMPEMDGYEATRRIRAGHAGKTDPDIPIIAMTAHAMKGDRDRCLDAGMTDYISKPIKPDLLLEVIEKNLTRQCQMTNANWWHPIHLNRFHPPIDIWILLFDIFP